MNYDISRRIPPNYTNSFRILNGGGGGGGPPPFNISGKGLGLIGFIGFIGFVGFTGFSGFRVGRSRSLVLYFHLHY